MKSRAHRAGLVREVAFGHARFGGAKDALAGARAGPGQYRQRGDAGEGARRLHLQTSQRLPIKGQLPLFAQLAIATHQLVLAKGRFAIPGVPGQDAPQVGRRQLLGVLHLANDGQYLVAVTVHIERAVGGQPFRFVRPGFGAHLDLLWRPGRARVDHVDGGCRWAFAIDAACGKAFVPRRRCLSPAAHP